MKTLKVAIFVCIGYALFWQLSITEAASTEDLRVLSGMVNGTAADEMIRVYLRGLVHEALDRRLAAYEQIKTQEQIALYQRRMRQFFREQLGDWPERSPLNARIVGERTFDDYRIEKIIYESQAGFYVTAVVYLPLTDPPYPGALLLCGHTDNGKAAEPYQRACILLAKNEIAVLCPDPIGQGERKQILNGGQSYPPTMEHMVAGVAPILLGRNLATYMIWDAMRGIDYLVSRKDIDASRIGCAGNSGGGNRTSYIMALDDRVVCAAPGCFITTTRRKNEHPGPGDAEQNIHAQIAFGMDHADYLLMRAPRPTLICAATKDYVPIEGAWETFRQAKRFYARLGYAERVDLIETDAQHGFSTQLRVATARWMRRWLLGSDVAIAEGDCPIMTEKELQCSRNGQVLRMEGARSIFDLNIEMEQKLAGERRRFWQASEKRKALAAVRKIASIRRLADLPQPKVETSGSLQRDGYRIDKIVLRLDEGFVLPALLFEPQIRKSDPYLYVHGNGKHIDSIPGGPIEKLVRAGHTVLAVDLRGCGETQCRNWRYGRAAQLLGGNLPEFFIAYMLGKSFVGMRAEDVLISARFLTECATATKHTERVHLIAVGEAAPPALHAAALEEDLFASLTLRRSLVSWSNVVYTPVTKGQLTSVVHAALTTYDLPDLIAAFGSDRLTIEEPLDAAGQPAASYADDNP